MIFVTGEIFSIVLLPPKNWRSKELIIIPGNNHSASYKFHYAHVSVVGENIQQRQGGGNTNKGKRVDKRWVNLS